MMFRLSIVSLLLVAFLAQAVSATLYWSPTWQKGEAHCGPWRKACRKYLSTSQQPDKFDICRIKDQNPYKAIRAACPDPADSDPAKEAERVRKILHDDLNYYSLSTYTNLNTNKEDDAICQEFLYKCNSAWGPRGTPPGMCTVKHLSSGVIAKAACLVPGIGEQLGWKLRN